MDWNRVIAELEQRSSNGKQEGDRIRSYTTGPDAAHWVLGGIAEALRAGVSTWLPISTNPPPQDGTWIALCNFAEDLETGKWLFYDGPYTARWHDFRWRDANNEEVDGCEYWSLIAKPERPQ